MDLPALKSSPDVCPKTAQSVKEKQFPESQDTVEYCGPQPRNTTEENEPSLLKQNNLIAAGGQPLDNHRESNFSPPVTSKTPLSVTKHYDRSSQSTPRTVSTTGSYPRPLSSENPDQLEQLKYSLEETLKPVRRDNEKVKRTQMGWDGVQGKERVANKNSRGREGYTVEDGRQHSVKQRVGWPQENPMHEQDSRDSIRRTYSPSPYPFKHHADQFPVPEKVQGDDNLFHNHAPTAVEQSPSSGRHNKNSVIGAVITPPRSPRGINTHMAYKPEMTEMHARGGYRDEQGKAPMRAMYPQVPSPGSKSPSPAAGEAIFLTSVRDINARDLPQNNIRPGKLVRVKYSYAPQHSDEFDLIIGDVYVMLLITADMWALGTKYEDALDYISPREEYHGDEIERTQSPGNNVSSIRRCAPRTRASCWPLIKFFPLEAMELLQSYEWGFREYTPTCSNLRLRSTIVPGITGTLSSSFPLRNPPKRTMSRKPDLIHEENKRLVTIAFDRFDVEVWQRIIQNEKFSTQRTQEEVIQTSPSPEYFTLAPPTTPCDPVSPTGTDFSWSPTPANSPAQDQRSNELGSIPAILSGPATSIVGNQAEAGASQNSETSPPNQILSNPEIQMDLSPPTFDSTKFSKLLDHVLEKGKGKHVFKETWRWATKKKEKPTKEEKKGSKQAVLPSIDSHHPKKPAADRVPGQALQEAVPSHNSAEALKAPIILENPEPTRVDTTSGESDKNPVGATGSTSQTSLPVKPGKLDPTTGFRDFTVTQHHEAKGSRPSVRDLFTPEHHSRDSNVPVRKSPSPETDAKPIAPCQDSTLHPEKSASEVIKPLVPKLTVNTQLPPLKKSHIAESPTSGGNNPIKNRHSITKATFQHWYGSKINSSSASSSSSPLGPRITNVNTPVNEPVQPDQTLSDANSSSQAHHTATREWLNMSLVDSMVKKARHSLRGKKSFRRHSVHPDFRPADTEMASSREENENERPATSSGVAAQGYESRSVGPVQMKRMVPDTS